MEEGLRFSATQMKKHMDAKRKTESMVIMPRPTVVTLERFEISYGHRQAFTQ